MCSFGDGIISDVSCLFQMGKNMILSVFEDNAKTNVMILAWNATDFAMTHIILMKSG